MIRRALGILSRIASYDPHYTELHDRVQANLDAYESARRPAPAVSRKA